MHQGGKKGALAFTAAVGYTSMREANPIKNADYFEQRTGFDFVCMYVVERVNVRSARHTFFSPTYMFLCIFALHTYVLLCMYVYLFELHIMCIISTKCIEAEVYSAKIFVCTYYVVERVGSPHFFFLYVPMLLLRACIFV